MQLNQSNYYTNEADNHYLSVSQMKKFAECEARAMAELKGTYTQTPTRAMEIGTYVHAHFDDEQALATLIDENNGSIFKKNGDKYADYHQADEMIAAVKSDELCMFALNGDKEQIFTANVFGADFKCKVDAINHDMKYFSDLKTTQQLDKRMWSDKYNMMVSFVEKYDYVMQMFVYREILQAVTGNYFDPYIVAVTKEDPPNKAVIEIDEERYVFEYEYVETLVKRVLQVKNGEEDAESCGKCSYCRGQKQLKDTIEVAELIN